MRRSRIFGLLLWGVVTFMTPWFSGYGMLLASRVLLGVSEGPLFSLASSYIKAHFEGTRPDGTPFRNDEALNVLKVLESLGAKLTEIDEPTPTSGFLAQLTPAQRQEVQSTTGLVQTFGAAAIGTRTH